jgi:hypothetical protein
MLRLAGKASRHSGRVSSNVRHHTTTYRVSFTVLGDSTMARRLHFLEFARALETGSMPDELLPQYLELDAERAVPRLVFRRDALLDVPPQEYDVDDAVYRAQRVRQGSSEEHERKCSPLPPASLYLLKVTLGSTCLMYSDLRRLRIGSTDTDNSA